MRTSFFSFMACVDICAKEEEGREEEEEYEEREEGILCTEAIGSLIVVGGKGYAE